MKKRDKILNNIGLKILAVVVSVLLWLISMSINDPVEEKTFRNLNVEMKNTQLLADEGKTWQVLDETDKVSVRVRAKRSVLGNISTADISVTADFADLSLTNAVPIEVSVNRYVSNQIQELDSNIDNVRLEVEDQIERQFVIDVVQHGEPAEGYIVSKITTTDGNAMRISGPKSIVSSVEQAVVDVEVTDLTDNINITERIHLLDASGNEINSSRITRSVTTSNISVTILAVKRVPLVFQTIGTPAEGYAATGEIDYAPASVMIAGRNPALSGVNEITVPAEELDLTGATESLVKLVDIRAYLPANIILANTDAEEFNGKAAVTVVVEELQEISVPVNKESVQFVNVPEGYVVKPEMAGRVPVRLLALQSDLDAFDEDSMVGVVDIAAWMEENEMTELQEGKIDVEVSLLLPESIELVNEVSFTAVIEKIEQE